MRSDNNNAADDQNDHSSEARLSGLSVSRGRAVGRAITIYGDNKQFYRIKISPTRVASEISRFRSAHETASRRLIIAAAALEKSISSTSIFELHRTILEDSSISQKVQAVIETEKVNAEWAVKLVMDNYIAHYRAIPDEHFRDRYIDVEDVAEQLQSALSGRRDSMRIPPDSVIVAQELRPSTLAELDTGNLAAIVTENGGWTSHSFILARELEIPAIAGVKSLLRRVRGGDLLLVEAYEGDVYVNPSPRTVEKNSDNFNSRPLVATTPLGADSLKTLDGRKITIRANFDVPERFQDARKLGAEGVGLFRSEYLFNRNHGFPEESEQVRTYSLIGDYAGEHRARIRTFDLSITQLDDFAARREQNPALGLRGVRLSLQEQKNFRIQVSAIIQASHGRAIDIILPMVTGVDEVIDARSIIEEECDSLKKRGINIGRPGLGAMIEVPAAALSIRSILSEVDCVCVGTNDLVQYTLAVDRDNETVAPWFRTLHPSIIKILGIVLGEAEEAGKPAVICGEMAGSPFYVPLLVGLGAIELSMNVNSISRVRKVIEGIAFEEARKMVKIASGCKSADEVEEVVRSYQLTTWKNLFPQHRETPRNSV